MLELRPTCENCNRALPPHSEEAMICTYECTFCKTCVEEILENVCPNCGGGFEKRPIRPAGGLQKYPPGTQVIFKPIDFDKFSKLKQKNINVHPKDR